MGISISDFDRPVRKDRMCSRCGTAYATDSIEWEDDDMGGRWWSVYCEPCLAITVDEHNAYREREKVAEAQRAYDEALREELEREAFIARFKTSPDTFCEECGYRACRCRFDRLTGRSGNVAFTR